jgi:neuropeptide S receptor 1
LAFLWILLILIVVGNMAVLVALSMSSARKSRMNYFIKHLAIAGKKKKNNFPPKI